MDTECCYAKIGREVRKMSELTDKIIAGGLMSIGLIGGVTSSIEIYNNPEQLTMYLAATGSAVLIKKGIDKFRELYGDQRVYDIIKGIGLFSIGTIGSSKTINLLINHYDQLLTYYSMIGSVTTGLKGIDYLTRKKGVENPDL